MSQNQAAQFLRQYPAKMTVADLYDEDEPFAQALNALIPGFEYPDFSYRTVGDILRAYA